MRHVVTVPSERYRMSTAALAAMLERLTSEGRRILAVVATAGQTATGSFDDLEAVGVLCERYGVWLHVDGAHGASALLSERHRHRLRGIERAHSLAWDPHKMMQLPLAGGTVLVRDRRWLDATFTQHAPYLFAPADGGENWNIGVRSFQCSRRADALKAWVALQRYGRRGIADIYDMLCDLTVRFHEMLVAHPRFEPLHAPECNILCFRWSGGGPPLGDDAVQATIRERLNRSGAGWITATVLEGRHVLRVTIQNPRTTQANLARLLDRLDAAAAEQPLPSHGLSAL
jgi:L-2,4-diaminobutyrate decarboxylase